MEERGVSRPREKLPRCGSLQDNAQEAEMVWDVIAKRYPNATPLLREMESAIERAEDLLHRLRSAPYYRGKEIERTSSDESDKMVTAHSGTSTDTNSDEIEMVEAGTRTSAESVADIEIETSSNTPSSDRVRSVDKRESVDSSSRFVAPNIVDDSTITNDIIASQTNEEIPKKNTDRNRTNFSNLGDRDSAVSMEAKEITSLEKWDKVVGDSAPDSKRINVKKAVAIVPPDRSSRSDETNSRSKSPHRIAKVGHPTPKEPGKILEESSATTTALFRKESTRSSVPKRESLLGPKRRAKSTPDQSPIRNANHTSIPVRKDIEQMRNAGGTMKGSGDDNTPKRRPKRTAVDILNEYAEHSKKKVSYAEIKNKVECTFAGYKAASIKSSKDPRETAAKDVLKLLAEREVGVGPDDLKNLPSFSIDQMRDIFALVDYQHENAMIKLYKLCLERNAPIPVYTVQQDFHSMEGVKHSAECKALNEVGTGSGVRENIAKWSAAEDLCRKLCLQHD